MVLVHLGFGTIDPDIAYEKLKVLAEGTKGLIFYAKTPIQKLLKRSSEIHC